MASWRSRATRRRAEQETPKWTIERVGLAIVSLAAMGAGGFGAAHFGTEASKDAARKQEHYKNARARHNQATAHLPEDFHGAPEFSLHDSPGDEKIPETLAEMEDGEKPEGIGPTEWKKIAALANTQLEQSDTLREKGDDAVEDEFKAIGLYTAAAAVEVAGGLALITVVWGDRGGKGPRQAPARTPSGAPPQPPKNRREGRKGSGREP